MNVVRLGQLGGNKNTFFGAKMNPATTQVLACTFTGCFYLWRNQELSLRDWEIFPTITGHSRPVAIVDSDYRH